MSLTVSIAGTTVTPDLGGLSIEQNIGSRHVCSIDWTDPSGTGLHPALGDEVLVVDTCSGRAFGGLVGQVREEGMTAAALVGLKRGIEAYDFGGLCDQRVVNASWSSATLKTILLDLTSDYLSTFGVALSSDQATGANMGELSYEYRVLTDVLNDLQTRSGYAWRLNYDKVLRMSTAGTAAAPTVVNSTNRVALSIEWEQNNANYANRQYISYGPSGNQVVSDYWTATTAQQSFPLHYTDLQTHWVAYESGIGYPVGASSGEGLLYYYDSASNTLYRSSSGIANGTLVTFDIQVPFPQITYADTTDHVDNPHEAVNTFSALADGTDYASAQALAAAQLTAVGDGTAKRVTFYTYTDGFAVGQTVTITMPDRHLSGTHLITGVRAVHEDGTADRIKYQVDCVSGDYSQGTFLDTYRQWGGSGGTGSGVVIGAGSASTASVSSLHAHLGGSRTQVLISTSTAYTPVVEYQEFVAPIAGTYTLRSQRLTESTAVGVTVRLWDVTSTGAVTGSESTASLSTAWVEATASVSLEAGHRYRAEVLGSTGTAAVACGQVTVEL